MARKKKLVEITDIDLEAVYTPECVEELNQTAESPSTEKYDNVVAAAKELIRLYTLGHTIINYDSYRYPGLKELVLAVEALS